MNIFKIKKMLDKTELTKKEKRTIMMLGCVELVLNCWKLPLRLIMSPFWLIYHFLGWLFTSASDIIYNLNEYIRDNIEITLGHKELKQKMYNELKRINDKKVKKEDIKGN